MSAEAQQLAPRPLAEVIFDISCRLLSVRNPYIDCGVYKVNRQRSGTQQVGMANGALEQNETWISQKRRSHNCNVTDRYSRKFDMLDCPAY